MKLETPVAVQFDLFAYLFPSAAISQSIPHCREGCFHTDILLFFPSPSHGLCRGHFGDVDSPFRWLSGQVVRMGRQLHCAWPPCLRQWESAGGRAAIVHTPFEEGGRAGSFSLRTLMLIQNLLFPLRSHCLSLDRDTTSHMHSAGALNVNQALALHLRNVPSFWYLSFLHTQFFSFSNRITDCLDPKGLLKVICPKSPEQGHLPQAQSYVQPGLKCFQGWGFSA